MDEKLVERTLTAYQRHHLCVRNVLNVFAELQFVFVEFSGLNRADDMEHHELVCESIKY